MLKENEFERYQDDKPQANQNNIANQGSKPIHEGQPMGGQNFGRNNNTPAGDDRNNPSRNAGYSNAYFRRTEPSEEHPEDSNFKPAYQEGEPDYNSAQPYAKGGREYASDHEAKSKSSYQQGTADDEIADHDISNPDNEQQIGWGDNIL